MSVQVEREFFELLDDGGGCAFWTEEDGAVTRVDTDYSHNRCFLGDSYRWRPIYYEYEFCELCWVKYDTEYCVGEIWHYSETLGEWLRRRIVGESEGWQDVGHTDSGGGRVRARAVPALPAVHLATSNRVPSNHVYVATTQQWWVHDEPDFNSEAAQIVRGNTGSVVGSSYEVTISNEYFDSYSFALSILLGEEEQ